MAYGYRLNAEDVFFRLAETEFAKAEKMARKIEHSDPVSGDDQPFFGYPDEEAIVSASIAVVGWATCFEAFVNSAWNQHVTPKCPTEKVSTFVIKGMSTIEKAKELLKMFSVDTRPIVWLADLNQLYSVRNRVIHYKEEVAFQGFSMAAQWEIDLSQERCRAFRTAIISAITLIGKKADIRTNFIQGSYELVYIDA